ncbi:TonB family protein [Acinetobacter sp. VNK23]|uniref:energy transducer TonB n=1 Tax=Acinetobacter thutiue TaxID=2998078 RepID=UPI002578501B|nr:energy transducer TonB [Acinetobacter thutiue]MDM1021614.1 TonB family protein [Acinetobacter thutiue]
MKKIIIASVLLMIISGCSKQDEPQNQSDSTSSDSETYDNESSKFSGKSYGFPEIPNDEFYENIVLINSEETYRKMRFEDIETGTKVVGAGLVHSLQKQYDGEETAIISTKTILNHNAGLYELLGSKTNFNGNLALLVFDKSKKTRVLENDNIAFKGILAPVDLYTYTNSENKVENIPIIYVHYYKSGELTTPMINEFLEKPKKVENKNDTVKPQGDTEKVSSVPPKIKTESVAVKEEPIVNEITEKPKAKEVISVNSNQVRWVRAPKLSVTSSDLDNEHRSVMVLVESNEQGRIIKAEITKSSGLPALDEKVIRAARSAKFEPYVDNGEHYSIRAEIPFELSP